MLKEILSKNKQKNLNEKKINKSTNHIELNKSSTSFINSLDYLNKSDKRRNNDLNVSKLSKLNSKNNSNYNEVLFLDN